jgi:mono/diheme cytochrome c family protein
MPGLEDVTVVTWQRACANCHGPLGRGDGPQGAMVKARNLSDPAWQSSVTDAQIATSIAKGRGLMPPFSLPASTIQGLVKLVRLLDKNRMAQAEQAARAGSAGAPAPSAEGAPSPSSH